MGWIVDQVPSGGGGALYKTVTSDVAVEDEVVVVINSFIWLFVQTSTHSLSLQA